LEIRQGWRAEESGRGRKKDGRIQKVQKGCPKDVNVEYMRKERQESTEEGKKERRK